MRALQLSLMISLLVAIFACSSKLPEEKYYEKAKDAYTKNNFNQAVQNFKDIVTYYPEGKRAPEALFMLGFINANDLKKYDEAKKYYTEFIKKYPKHELADDAQYEIQNLGKDVNDLPIFKHTDKDSVQK